MRSYSTGAQEAINALSAGESPILLLEIDHADLVSPIRIVNDTQDVTHLSNLYTALAFEATPPDEPEQGLPTATLRVDNVGRELVSWIDASIGGRGATARMIQIMRSAPDVIEWEATLNLNNVQVTPLEVTAGLGYDDILNQPAVALSYRPDTHPGLY